LTFRNRFSTVFGNSKERKKGKRGGRRSDISLCFSVTLALDARSDHQSFVHSLLETKDFSRYLEAKEKKKPTRKNIDSNF